MVIDAKPKDLGLPTEAYVMVEEVHDVSSAVNCTEPHPLYRLKIEKCCGSNFLIKNQNKGR